MRYGTCDDGASGLWRPELYTTRPQKNVFASAKSSDPNIRIEVDGGIDPKTAPIVVSYGADTLVAGNAFSANPTEPRQ